MNKCAWLCIAALVLTLAACEGPLGGGPSDPGGTYLAAKLLTGTGGPLSSLGSDGDLYLDTQEAVLYVKYSGAWSDVAVLRGPAGSNGSTWSTGTGTPADALGADGDFYLDTASSDVYKKVEGTWTLVADLGQAGSPAAEWTVGDGEPQAGAGDDGDFHIDTSSSLIYRKIEGEWSVLASMEGPPGVPGSDGAAWLAGESDPASDVGDDGDYYLNTTTTAVFRKTGGAWGSIVILRGLAGADGADGQDGATWHSGPGAPSEATGDDGDHYLDITNAVIYGKAGGTWSALVPLIGPAGLDGKDGVNGEEGTVWFVESGNPNGEPPFALGKLNDLYLDSASGNAYVKTETEWVWLMTLRGPVGADGTAGAPGANGLDGAAWYTGEGDPVTTGTDLSDSADGDLYLDTATADVYARASGAWSLSPIMNIRGSQGPQGPQGIQGEVGPQGPQGLQGLQGNDGSTWYTGAGTPAATTTDLSSSADGDLYLNTTNADLYVRASGAWGASPILNLKGAPGVQGVQGVQGEVGPQGPQGLQGNDGSTWYTGAGTPAATTTDLSLSADGDLYLNTTNADLYVRASGAWGASPILNLKGAPGPQGVQGVQGEVGPQGPQGLQGNDGSTWYTGEGTPAANVALLATSADGDLFLDVLTANVYVRASGAWGATPIVNIRGPAGANGATWFVGSADPDGGMGAVGDFYLDAANSAIYKKTAVDAWTFQYFLTAASTGASIAFTVNPIVVVPPVDVPLMFVGTAEPGIRVFSGAHPLNVIWNSPEGLDFQWYLDGKFYASGEPSVSLTGLENGTHWIFMVLIMEGDDTRSSPTYSFQISSQGAPL